MTICRKCGKPIPGKYDPGEYVLCYECASEFKPKPVIASGVDRCVCCGAIIPEGAIICPLCADGVEHKM